MQVGILQIFQNYGGAIPDAQLWEEEVEMGLLAEQLGYDSLWCVGNSGPDHRQAAASQGGDR